MKRLFNLTLCLLVVTSITAKNSLKLKSGDSSVLGKAVRAFVVFDYSKSEIEGKSISLEDYIEQKGYKFENKWENAAQGGLSVAGGCRYLTKDGNTSIEKEGYIPYPLQA